MQVFAWGIQLSIPDGVLGVGVEVGHEEERVRGCPRVECSALERAVATRRGRGDIDLEPVVVDIDHTPDLHHGGLGRHSDLGICSRHVAKDTRIRVSRVRCKPLASVLMSIGDELARTQSRQVDADSRGVIQMGYHGRRYSQFRVDSG